MADHAVNECNTWHYVVNFDRSTDICLMAKFVAGNRRRKILKVGGGGLKDMITRAQKISDPAHFRSNHTHF